MNKGVNPLKKYILVSIGGFLGATSRFAVKSLFLMDNSLLLFPIGTLVVNITGSFALAFFLTLVSGILTFDEDIRTGVAVGFLGAYTTFSTLCKETVTLLTEGSYLYVAGYVVASVGLGLAGVYLGWYVAECILGSYVKYRQHSLSAEHLTDDQHTEDVNRRGGN